MSCLSESIAFGGWLLVDKTAGYTSTAIVNKTKKLLNIRKAGHLGTLDPDATGLLAIALGEATKIIPYVADTTKTYQFQIFFGAATDTDDTSGEKIKISTIRPTDLQLKTILKQFRGKIKQVPPNYSAIKVRGKRAYELSRNGSKNLKLEARNLCVEEIDIIERIDPDSAKIKMICSRGGYVRSIARDIGERLGCFGHAGNIRRISSGPFTLSDAISNTLIFNENSQKVIAKLLPIQYPLDHLKSFDCTVQQAKEIKYGRKLPIFEGFTKKNIDAFACFKNRPIAIGEITNNYFYPKRVLNFKIDE